MDVSALFLGNFVVWMFGAALLAATPAPASGADTSASRAWTIGCGWFAGAFLLTLWMRAVSLAGVPFGIASVGAPMLIAMLAATGLAWRNARNSGMFAPRAIARDLAGADLSAWQRGAWVALMAWLALRYALLLAEVLWRPLYPWDAWTQWGTKARVWFELKTMVPFVPLAEWLQPGNTAYIDTAPNYPATVPLMQVWSALLLGRWDDVLVNLPWWITAVAFAIALYGFFIRRGWPPQWALVVTWLVASMPILNAHVALAGYADLAMAAYLTLGVLAAMQWLSSRQWRDAALAALLFVACVTIKNPGKMWLVVLIPGAVAAILPKNGRKIAAAAIASAILALLLLARTNPTVLGYQLHLEFVPPWRGLAEAYFALGNWHLLWYAAIATAIIARRQLFTREMAPLTIVIGTGLLFLLFGFAFTNVARWVEDQSTVNRATLHLAPLVIVWMALLFRAWAVDSAAASPPPLASTPAAA